MFPGSGTKAVYRMFLNLLISLSCVTTVCDTIDVATVSTLRNTEAHALAPVRRISEAKIQRLGAVGLHEVLNQFSGVSIRDYGGVGGLKTVSVRNMGASHTSVIYDGIAISDAQNGQVDISRFNLDDISSVSMSIGLQDEIFTSARHLTSAGILRLESQEPDFEQGTTEINMRLTAASFDTYNPYISIKQKLGSSYALKASANATFSKGDYPFVLTNGNLVTKEYRLNSDVQTYGAEVDFYADWNTCGELKAKVNYHQSERGLPGSVVLYTQDAYERLWDRSVISNIMYDVSFGKKWKLHADAGFTHSFNRHLDTDPAFPIPQDSRYSQNEYSLAARALYSPSSRWKIAIAEDFFINTLTANIPECPSPVRFSSATALSAQYSGSRLKATACLVGMAIAEMLDGEEAPADRFRLSPMVGLSWNFYHSLCLRASFKEGFRVPTFNDLYYARVGNPNLNPEIARQYNLGLTFNRMYEWGYVDFTADAYYNSIKDKIVAMPTMFIWTMRNFGEVAMWGADINASIVWRAAKWLTTHISGNYSLQYALDITDPDSKNYRHQIPYTPRHCGGANLTLSTPWFNLSYRVSASGKRYSMNQNIPSNEIDGYADHGLSLNRNFEFGTKRIYKLYAGLDLNNISGDNYNVIRYYPMPGRSFRVTLKFNY